MVAFRTVGLGLPEMFALETTIERYLLDVEGTVGWLCS